jgi:F-box/leucine-rich repeat protein 10/11
VSRLCWFVAEKYLRQLRAKEEFPNRVLESLDVLGTFLISEVRVLEKGSESGKREAKDMIPTDKIKDAPALARELRWRVRLAMGYSSGDESKGRAKSSTTPSTNGTAKRKREGSEVSSAARRGADEPTTMYKNFKPRDWDVERKVPGGLSLIRRKAAKPVGETVGERWIEWDDTPASPREMEADDEAQVEIKRDVVTRARRFVRDGAVYVERHRAERILELWRWPETSELVEPEPAKEIGVDSQVHS